jgi:gamma-polyglutamate biosynthesis protein CapC
MNDELYLLVGVIVSILFTEFSFVSPGGVIVPGYIAIFWDDPLRIIATLATAVLTLALVRGMDRVVLLYGRRRFAAAIVLSFALRGLIDLALPTLPLSGLGMTVGASGGTTAIGWLVPAIITIEMDRQGMGVTLGSMAGVSALVRLVGEMWP